MLNNNNNTSVISGVNNTTQVWKWGMYVLKRSTKIQASNHKLISSICFSITQ